MWKCKKCGFEHHDEQELCPMCGYGPNIETITEIPEPRVFEKREKKEKKKRKKDQQG